MAIKFATIGEQNRQVYRRLKQFKTARREDRLLLWFCFSPRSYAITKCLNFTPKKYRVRLPESIL